MHAVMCSCQLLAFGMVNHRVTCTGGMHAVSFSLQLEEEPDKALSFSDRGLAMLQRHLEQSQAGMRRASSIHVCLAELATGHMRCRALMHGLMLWPCSAAAAAAAGQQGGGAVGNDEDDEAEDPAAQVGRVKGLGCSTKAPLYFTNVGQASIPSQCAPLACANM